MTPDELLEKHTAQGNLVRTLKAEKGGNHPDVAAALQELLNIKAQYKELTGEPVPGPAKPASSGKKDKKKEAKAPAPAADKSKAAGSKADKSKSTKPAKASAPAAAAAAPKPAAAPAAAAAPTASASGNPGGMYRAPVLALSTDVKTTNPDVAGRTMYSIRSYRDGQPDVVIPEPSAAEYNPRAAGLAPEVNALALRFDRVASEADRLIKISEAEILKRGGVIPAGGGGDEMDRVLSELSGLLTTVNGEIAKRGGSVPSAMGGGAAVGGSACTVGKHGEILDPSKARKPSATKEISLFANPASFVRTPLVLAELLRAQGTVVDVRQYWHNSVSSSSAPSAEELRTRFHQPRGECDVRINLIWKAVERTTMIVSPSHHVPIEGDANIARYLCRALYPSLYPADVVRATEVDALLDLAESLINASARNQKPALKQANQVLGKAAYLGGDSMSLADLHMWGCVAQSGASCDKNMKKWKAALDAHDAFAAATVA